jgi:hypothetical protein
MDSFNELLQTYYVFRHERQLQITDELTRLCQQIESQLLTIRQHETEFITAQQTILNQLRTQLAIDVRSLFTTPEFQTFVTSLLEQIEATVSKGAPPRHIASTSKDWLLTSLPFPLQLHDIDRLETDDTNEDCSGNKGIGVRVKLCDWQQFIWIPIQSSRPWFEVVPQFQHTLQQTFNAAIAHQFTSDLHPALAQELMCVATETHDKL